MSFLDNTGLAYLWGKIKAYVASSSPVLSVNGNTGAVTVAVPSAGSTAPAMDGTGAAGSSADYSRSDHVHPTDTSRAPASHTHQLSDLYNDIGFITDTELPSLAWATDGMTEIPANADLNSYTTPGSYYSPSSSQSATITNAPTTDARFILYVMPVGSNFFMQYAMDVYDAGHIYTRIYNNGSWLGWTRMVSEDSLPSLAFATTQSTDIPSNSNLNNYTTVGNYCSRSSTVSQTITNAPVTSSGFVLYVMRHGTGGNIYQFAIANATTLGIYSRMYTVSSSTWGSWNRLARASELKTYSVAHTNGSAVNVTTGTATTVQTIALSAGVWALECDAQFASNSTGYREIHLATTSGGGVMDRHSVVQIPAANGATTRLTFTTFFSLSASTTYYLVATQNSGSTLSVTPGYRYLKIS